MLQDKHRLTKVRDFNLLMDHGYWVNGTLVTLKVLDLAKNKAYYPKNEDPEKFQKQLKLAFTVGLKVSKRAVIRNRLKRQMREVVRLILKQEAMPEGYYLMFVAKPSLVNKDFAEISQEIKLLWKKAKLST